MLWSHARDCFLYVNRETHEQRKQHKGLQANCIWVMTHTVATDGDMKWAPGTSASCRKLQQNKVAKTKLAYLCIMLLDPFYMLLCHMLHYSFKISYSLFKRFFLVFFLVLWKYFNWEQIVFLLHHKHPQEVLVLEEKPRLTTSNLQFGRVCMLAEAIQWNHILSQTTMQENNVYERWFPDIPSCRSFGGSLPQAIGFKYYSELSIFKLGTKSSTVSWTGSQETAEMRKVSGFATS